MSAILLTVSTTTTAPTLSAPKYKKLTLSTTILASPGVPPVPRSTHPTKGGTLVTVAGVGLVATGTVPSHLTYTSVY